MLTYRILISDFHEELRSLDVSWVGRKFLWPANQMSVAERMNDYLRALADNTRKPPATCMTLAAKYAFPEASIEVLHPGQVKAADAAPE